MINAKKLLVSDRALQLSVEIYRLTKQFPRDERFGLTSQMRRAAVSVGSNIAEGCGRGGDKELVFFLHNAMGSASELEFQLTLAKSLQFATAEQLQPSAALIAEEMRMLSSFIASVKVRIGSCKRPR